MVSRFALALCRARVGEEDKTAVFCLREAWSIKIKCCRDRRERMAKAYQITSDPFYINASVTESAADTFTEIQVTAPLDSLNREGLLVHAAYFGGQEPERLANAISQVKMQITSTSKTGIVGVNDANLIAAQQKTIVGGAAEFSALTVVDMVGGNGQPYSTSNVLGIVATDDMFFGLEGVGGQTGAKQAQVRLVCSRIKLSADAYAALVTNELSS